MEKGISCVGIRNCLDFTRMLFFHEKIMMEVEVCPDRQNRELIARIGSPISANRELIARIESRFRRNRRNRELIARIGIPMTPRKMMESYLTNTPNNFKKIAQNSKSRDFAKCPCRLSTKGTYVSMCTYFFSANGILQQ